MDEKKFITPPTGYATVPCDQAVKAGDLLFHPNHKRWVPVQDTIGKIVNAKTWPNFCRKIKEPHS